MYEAVSAPTERARAAYWAGRSAAALGDRALARTWYQAAARHPVAYYGQLAAAELGEPLRAAAVPPPDADQRAAFEAREVVRVARMLIEIGADAQLRPFAMHLIGQASEPDRSRHGGRADCRERSRRSGHPGQPGRRLARPGQRGGGLPDPRSRQPARRPDEPPEAALLLGVARQESTFNTWGMSHAGAQGLLQLMPGTAHLMARALRMPYNRARLTADPDYNILLGRHYLRTLLERYDGEAVLAMSAYNAGPSRVEAWLELNGDPRRGDAARPGRLGRADPVRRDPQLRPAGARGAQHVPPAAGRRERREDPLPAGRRPDPAHAHAASQAAATPRATARYAVIAARAPLAAAEAGRRDQPRPRHRPRPPAPVPAEPPEAGPPAWSDRARALWPNHRRPG